MHNGVFPFIELPNEVTRKRACINVHNFGNKCIVWAFVLVIYPVERESQRITKYVISETVF